MCYPTVYVYAVLLHQLVIRTYPYGRYSYIPPYRRYQDLPPGSGGVQNAVSDILAPEASVHGLSDHALPACCPTRGLRNTLPTLSMPPASPTAIPFLMPLGLASLWILRSDLKGGGKALQLGQRASGLPSRQLICRVKWIK